ncbi:MAG TPA: TolC family protein [Longimicrobiales bacterium]
MAARIRTTAGAVLMLLFASALPAQEPPVVLRLSLEEALLLAEATSEPLVIAEAGVERARGEVLRARSEYFPQITGSATYTRTFQSEFSGFDGGGTGGAAPPPPRCGPFAPDTALPLPARVDTLERAVACLAWLAAGGGPPPDLSSLFGNDFGVFTSPHRYDFGLLLTVPLYTGGRRAAEAEVAEAGRRSADVEVQARRAQLTFDVARAYFDAALAQRLVYIAEQALAQAERALEVTLVAVEAGDQAEFDALRARVARDNQRAEVSRRRAEREIAFNRLRTLAGLPLDQPIELTTELGDEVPPAITKRAAIPEGPDTAATLRSTVRQAAEAVRIQEGLLRIARSQRLPQVSITGQYGRVAFSRDLIPGWDDFRTTAWLAISADVPIFTGGRLRADEIIARADLREASARFAELTELAAEDAAATLERLSAARAAFEATTGTIREAERAYEIAELRYREGAASLLELTDTRLMLEEALANRAIAARDLQVAQIRLVLLPDLPLEAVTAAGAGAIAATAAVTGGTVAAGAAAGVSAIVTRTQRLVPAAAGRTPLAPRTGATGGTPSGGGTSSPRAGEGRPE